MFAVYSFVFLIFLINTHSILCTTKTQHTKLINTFSGGATNEDDMGFKVLSSSLMYKGWRSIIRKKCLFPNKKVVDFDVVSQGCTSIIVVAWDTKTRTCTLIREYHPGMLSIYSIHKLKCALDLKTILVHFTPFL
jgi:hypothetical protein